MPGWGDVAGWIFDRFPTRREGIVNAIRECKRKRAELQNGWSKTPATDAERYLYNKLGDRLRQLEEKLETFKS